MKLGIYIWDENKNILNRRKHGIDFSTAVKAFNDGNRIEMYDIDHSSTEDRFILIGSIDGLITVVVVVFTERKGLIRIISARLANESERSLYYDSFC